MPTSSETAATSPRWDLSSIYPGLDSPQYQAAFQDLKEQLDALDQYMLANHIAPPHNGPQGNDPSELAQMIGEWLGRANKAVGLEKTLRAFTYAFVSTDSYDQQAAQALSRLQKLTVRLEQLNIQFQSWVGALAAQLPEIISQGETLQEHAFILKEAAAQSKYLMSAPEEHLAAELSISGAKAWRKLQGTVTSQLTVEFSRDGETETIPMPAIINIMTNDPDPEVRRRAYETEIAAWDTVKEPLAAALNGVKGFVSTLDRRRGRGDAVHSSLDLSRIDRPTLDAMLGAMQASFPTFRKYWRAKATRLGKEKLAWWDLFAPVGQSERSFTFPQARQFIIEQFGNFSSELADFARRAFEENWIDAEQREGKRGGAFCIALPDVNQSRVLCNFDGSLDQVFTIAHELGHAYHNECQRDQTALNRTNPMTLAETASIMCETIVTEAALAQAANPAEELAILETRLIGDAQVIVDIYSRYLFEQEVFQRRAEAELSADDFCDIMLRAQQATYGNALDERYRHKYMWTWKPHYYYEERSFYNYPYAFGLLFGIGLYAIYQTRGADFIPDYKELLASTGKASAADLASRFDIDIRTPEFWHDSLAVIGRRIDRYLEL